MRRRWTPTTCLGLVLLLGVPGWLEAQSPEPRFPPPQPKYKVRVERSVMVPMRDGVKLSTDLYFPEGAGDRLPIILIRTPYDKSRFYRREWVGSYLFAEQGYVVAVQDARGKFESEGDYVMNAADVKDGYDAAEWLAAQPWSTGKVGTYGCSYLGEAQYLQAKLRSPHVAAMVPQGAGPTKYRYFGVTDGGAFELAAAFGWMRLFGSKVYLRPPPGAGSDFYARLGLYFNPAPVLPKISYREMLASLPVIEMMKKAGGLPTDFEDILSHGPGDPWWDTLGYIKDTDRFDVPALHINSWYDFGVGETLKLFNLLRTNAESARARDHQFAVISPTTHCQSERVAEKTVVGQRDLGDAQFDYWGLYLRWFDYWLKGTDNGVTRLPKLQIYVMGKNQWRGENEWPLARTQFTKYYLHSDGAANSRFGTGTLSPQAPGEEAPDRYRYDPGTPVPTSGGTICAACAASGEVAEGALDQRDVETRHDVLVYTTSPLEKGIEVTGPLQVVLYVSSSAPDTDFTARLVDVYPDGTAYNVQEGILRARYREGFEKKVWMEPGQVYEVRINLHATSNYFGPGHRIRLEVSSSNFPRFDRNLNTSGNNYDETQWKVADNTIHHSPRHASYLLLPVIP